MANRWGYGLLVAIAVALVGHLIYLGSPFEATGKEPIQPYRLFPELLAQEQIIGLELLVPDEEFAIRVVNEGDEVRWRLANTETLIPVDPNAPNFARWRLASAEGVGQIDATGIPLESFGLLPNPQYVIRFQLDDLRVLELQVGHLTASGKGYYVTIDPNGVIVDVVETFWIDEIVGYLLSIQPLELQADLTPTPVP
jgi:hypothetical protein